MNFVRKTITTIFPISKLLSQMKTSCSTVPCPQRTVNLTNPIYFGMSTRRRFRKDLNPKQQPLSMESEERIVNEINSYSKAGQHDKVILLSLSLLKQYLSTNKIDRPKYLQELLSLSYYAINTRNYDSAQDALLELHQAPKQQAKSVGIEDDQIPYMLGYVFSALKKYEMAKEYYGKVLQTEKAKADPIFNACVNTEIINMHHKLNQDKQALQRIPFCQQILMSETIEDDKIAQVCSGLLTLSKVQNNIGDKRKSLQKLERSIKLLSKVNDFNKKVVILQALIEVNAQLNFPHENGELIQETINLLPEQKISNEKQQDNSKILNPIENLILWNEKGINHEIILQNSTKIEEYLNKNKLQNHLIAANLKYQKGRSLYKIKNYKESQSNFKLAFEELQGIKQNKDCKFMQGRCLAYQVLNKHEIKQGQQTKQAVIVFINHVEKYGLSNHKTDQIKYLLKLEKGEIEIIIEKIKDLIKENKN